jgi:hypothetical protein
MYDDVASLSLARLSQCVAVNAITPVFLRVFLALARLFLARLYHGHKRLGISPPKKRERRAAFPPFFYRASRWAASSDSHVCFFGYPAVLPHPSPVHVLLPCVVPPSLPPSLSPSLSLSLSHWSNRLKPLLIPLKLYIVWRAVAGNAGGDPRP